MTSLLNTPEVASELVDPFQVERTLNQMEAFDKDINVSKLVLDIVKKGIGDLNVVSSITSGEVSRTIEGASTLSLTIHDQGRKILKSGRLWDGKGRLRTIDVQLDGLWFRLVKVAKAGDDLNLTFEDREVALLREHKGPRKASRAKFTRAEFVQSLVRRVRHHRIRFYCPELHKKQPLGKDTRKNKRQRDAERRKGFADGEKVQGVNKAQLKRIATALTVADELKASERAVMGMLCAGFGESDFGENRGSRGTTFQTLQISESELDKQAYHFLKGGRSFLAGGAIGYAREHPKASPGEIASKVEISDKGGAYYDKYRGKARAVLEAWGGASGGSVSRYKRYEFKVGKGEDYWTAIKRMADEVKWRVFVVSGVLYFIAEEDLYKSRPRFRFTERTPGIDNIDFDIDKGKVANTATVSARIDRWAAPPGTVVVIPDLGLGRWLVASVTRPLFSAAATITLKRPTHSGPEPRPDTTSSDSEGAASGSDAGAQALDAAREIHAKHYPYVWGGGHGKAGSPSGGGYDCSGGVAAVLKKIGLAPAAWDKGVPSSGVMARSWGEPGPGRYLTMYANGEHVFLVAEVDGKKYHLGTGDWGKGWGGFGVNKRLHPTAGFTARHYKGT